MEEDQTDYPARPAPVRLAFRVSYLGSRFFGSQMQAQSRTVEGEFIAACQRLSLFSDWRQAGFQSAGRTDRGVHSRGQVIAFTTDAPDRAIGTVNLQLPPDLWCSAYAEVPAEFHPRYDAKSRTYRYYFSEVPKKMDEMEKAYRHFLGIHDFSHFARVKDKNPVRNILAIRVDEEDGFVFLEVTAESFLWHQVRCMATAILRDKNRYPTFFWDTETNHFHRLLPKGWCSGIRIVVCAGHRLQSASAAASLSIISPGTTLLWKKYAGY